MKILHIDSSISGSQSVSRQLTASIVARLQATTPGLDVLYRDIAATPIPHQSGALHARRQRAFEEASGAPSGDAVKAVSDQSSGTPDAAFQQEIAVTDAVLDEFLAADIVVVGVPMYNFSIPSQLKTWIDCLSVRGKTFSYSESGATGLCGGKRVIIASSRGGIYTAPSPMAGFDHQESYLASFFGFIGITDIAFVRAEGVNYGPEHRQRALDSALAEVTTLQVA